MAKRASKEVLPKAPMVEVVFEVRWNLQSGPEPLLRTDPGLVPLIERFTKQMGKIGFSSHRDMSHPLQTGAYGVARRFYRAPDRPFPIQQIGAGIYATNEDAQYDWQTFKAQALRGLRALFVSYPKLDFFPITINHLELRYVDVFKPELVSARDGFVGFLRDGMNVALKLPEMFEDPAKVEGSSAGRVVVRRTLKGRRETVMVVDIGTATQTAPEDVFRMETKVITTNEGVPAGKPGARMERDIGRWLDFAHDILSPAFKQLVKEEVRTKYGLAN